MAQKYLFVGGSADGRRVELVDTPEVVRFYTEQSFANAAGERLEPSPDDTPHLIPEQYLRYDLSGWRFYHHENLSVDQVMRRLLACYEPELRF